MRIARWEELVERGEDEPCVAVDLTAVREDRNPAVGDVEFCEGRAWHVGRDEALRVRDAAQLEIPDDAPGVRGEDVVEEDEVVWWGGRGHFGVDGEAIEGRVSIN